jgi:hypothetical protein
MQFRYNVTLGTRQKFETTLTRHSSVYRRVDSLPAARAWRHAHYVTVRAACMPAMCRPCPCNRHVTAGSCFEVSKTPATGARSMLQGDATPPRPPAPTWLRPSFPHQPGRVTFIRRPRESAAGPAARDDTPVCRPWRGRPLRRSVTPTQFFCVVESSTSLHAPPYLAPPDVEGWEGASPRALPTFPGPSHASHSRKLRPLCTGSGSRFWFVCCPWQDIGLSVARRGRFNLDLRWCNGTGSPEF